jgi:hypothetical protein
MKTKFFYSLILVVGLAFAGTTINNVYGQTPKTTDTKAKAVKYTCPMHPEVAMNKPGKCPKCGMTLVEKKVVKKAVIKKDQPTKEKEMPMK